MSERSLLSITFLFLSYPSIAPAVAQQPKATVPFVGCKSDGQLGPVDAPKGRQKELELSPEVAPKVAYYQAEGTSGVIAPRGWFCFSTYGSAGWDLFVSPTPINRSDVFSDKWHGFTGPAIQLTLLYGGTSGRFGVAEIIARVFPSHVSFVQRLMADQKSLGITDTSIPSGPYPSDRLVYQSKEIVKYTTPPNTEGLGTYSRLVKNSDPIQGATLLTGDEPLLIHLAVRLPPQLRNLTADIIQQVERDAHELKD